jgi:MraZ protein
MLIGTYRHQIDEKCRMRMPAKLKAELGEGFVITKGTNGCLTAFSKTKFDEVYNKLTNLPIFDANIQKPVRMILSSAFETEEDKQGRILVAKELRDYAKIQKNIVFVGAGNRVEIWAEEEWDTYADGDLAQSINSLSGLGV